MSKQAMNYLLGQLESLGYLERRPDPSDQRGRLVHLTRRGAAAGATMRATVEQVEREWSELIGAKDINQLRTLLQRLTTALGTTVFT
jgi:DNA-binding MarR family transcriptional regulator